MRASDFDFDLPPALVAQTALEARDQSRLLVVNRADGSLGHHGFGDLGRFLKDDDVLVLNNSRVIRARLRGANERTSGRFELMLVEQAAANDWWAMLKPGKRARLGTRITLLEQDGKPSPIVATVTAINDEGYRRMEFEGCTDVLTVLERLGEVPLPPYIRRAAGPEDAARYQTVFARPPGSVAAPTAGLHFTRAMLDRLEQRGIRVCEVTLHVGLGTFAPVKADDLAGHVMHEERYEIGDDTARAVNEARRAGRRIVAVGTTSLRTLESATDAGSGGIAAGYGRTRLFVRPPFQFHVVDALLTNFHLPRSTLLMLVSAFAAPGSAAGRELILNAYAEAVRRRYRFFSYGDAMFIQ